MGSAFSKVFRWRCHVTSVDLPTMKESQVRCKREIERHSATPFLLFVGNQPICMLRAPPDCQGAAVQSGEPTLGRLGRLAAKAPGLPRCHSSGDQDYFLSEYSCNVDNEWIIAQESSSCRYPSGAPRRRGLSSIRIFARPPDRARSPRIGSLGTVTITIWSQHHRNADALG